MLVHCVPKGRDIPPPWDMIVHGTEGSPTEEDGRTAQQRGGQAKKWEEGACADCSVLSDIVLGTFTSPSGDQGLMLGLLGQVVKLETLRNPSGNLGFHLGRGMIFWQGRERRLPSSVLTLNSFLPGGS